MLSQTPAQRVALLFCGGLCVLAVACTPSAPDPILGVRLGMTPAQVRARFAPGAAGTYRSEAMDEDFALVWEPSAGGDVLGARHEFHEGLLVAVRLSVTTAADVADGPPLEATPLSLLTREVVSERIALTWLARSCPTHAAEVERRMQSVP